MNIQYVIGDATDPIDDGRDRLIVHVCNDLGRWGAGFTRAVSRRWAQPEACYRARRGDLELGEVQFVRVAPRIAVANMIAQHGLRSPTNSVPLNYFALAQCLESVARWCLFSSASVHGPYFGCGLAGGQWSGVSKILAGTVGITETPITIYGFTAEEAP
jgi:O-acetyl-ADP-ribose deacetylase (regulator of RNase III)